MIWRVLMALIMVGCLTGQIMALLKGNTSAAIGWTVAFMGWANVAWMMEGRNLT